MKRTFIFAMLMAVGATLAGAQTKKPAPKQPSGKHAVVQLPGGSEVKGMAEGATKMYLNTGDNVYSVDKASGDVKLELTNNTEGLLLGRGVKAIAAHQSQLYYWVAGKGLFLKGSDEDKPIFHDEDVNPSYMEMVGSGDHLLIFGRGGHSICLDLRSFEATPKWPASASNMAMAGGKAYIIGTDGHISSATLINDTIESTSEFKNVVTIYRTGERPERFQDRVCAKEVFIENGTGSYDSFCFLASAPNGEVYTAVKNRLLTVPGFSEVFTMEDKIDNPQTFTCRGTKAFINTGYYEYPLLEIDGFRTGKETLTKHKTLQTDILEPKLWEGASDRYFSNSRFWTMHVDMDGNLWCTGEYGKVFVYNAAGIKGYRNLKGKLVKIE
ncbi:MAG: hypothetical protein IKT82_01405 [Bacteroidaceae bacterium]|nr:hypothetical protein [Bacteroidaceae bacterium]